jgi:serine/threonine protein kinase
MMKKLLPVYVKATWRTLRQNIFVSPNGEYKLGDFCIAKTVEKTMGGTKIGTYKYMAPEVYNNQPYGSAADISSLGLVLYWMLNERRMPFMPQPPVKLTAAMDEEARKQRLLGVPLPPPAHGSEALKCIVLKACAYDPRHRFAGAQAMLDALESIGKDTVEIWWTDLNPDDKTVPLNLLPVVAADDFDKTVALFPGDMPQKFALARGPAETELVAREKTAGEPSRASEKQRRKQYIKGRQSLWPRSKSTFCRVSVLFLHCWLYC